MSEHVMEAEPKEQDPTEKESASNLHKKSIIVQQSDIVHEEFYVLAEEDEHSDVDEVMIASTRVTITGVTEPGKEDGEEFVLVEGEEERQEEEEEEEVEPKVKSSAADDLGTDFFDRQDEEDSDKKQVVQEIAGMTEASEDVDEKEDEESDHEEAPKEELKRPSGVLAADQEEIPKEKRPSTQVVDDATGRLASRPSMTDAKRTSARASFMVDSKSKKALLPSHTSSMVGKRKSFLREGTDLLASMEYYEHRPTLDSAGVRKSMAYSELGPRYRQEVEDLLEGFEISKDVPIFFEVSQEEEEEVVVVEEEVVTKLEREPYYTRHDHAVEAIAVRKMRNFILHKKTAMYFKRKKMDYVTKETDWSYDAQHKYYKKLEGYGDLMDLIRIEKERVTADLEETKIHRMEMFQKLAIMFKKMQDREGEVGYGLINTKTGNVIADKFVDRLLRRQSTQMAQVSAMRLTFIRLKGMVQEKLDAIANLDEIAPGFLLADYEQLKSDNRAYGDKIEERDEELTRLRAKCGNTIQVLAHLREKSAAFDRDLDDLQLEQKELDQIYCDVRRKLNTIKQNRDNVRHAINKLRDESGLLTQPSLLKDMEQGLTEFKILNDQLVQIMKEHKKRARQIKTIRKRIEETVGGLRRGYSGKSLSKIKSFLRSSFFRKDKQFQLYKGRPTLMVPIIESSAFDCLASIKPTLTYDKSQIDKTHLKHKKRQGG